MTPEENAAASSPPPSSVRISWKVLRWPAALAAVFVLDAWYSFWNGPVKTRAAHTLVLITHVWQPHVPVSMTVIGALILAAGFVLMIFVVVFMPTFWSSLAEQIISTLVVLTCLSGLVGVFAEAYLQFTHESPRCFGTYLGHVNAIYVTITTFTNAGAGDFKPLSTSCRLLVAGQSVIGLAIVAIAISGLAARLISLRIGKA
jgi:hypothetical protein